MGKLSLAFAFALGLAGCLPRTAVVAGKSVPRVNLAYSDGRFFWLTHRAAYPDVRGPARGKMVFAGAIAGRICGADGTFDAWFLDGDEHMVLSGFLSDTRGERPPEPWTFEIFREGGGVRRIQGGRGGFVLPETTHMVMPVMYSIDFRLTPGALEGWVGEHHFSLRAGEDDRLVGKETMQSYASDYIVEGVSKLYSMPPPDQAMILAAMLVCPTSVHDVAGLHHGFSFVRR